MLESCILELRQNTPEPFAPLALIFLLGRFLEQVARNVKPGCSDLNASQFQKWAAKCLYLAQVQ